ncbi:hypothetical protein ABZV31_15600 [Streptomyces sp. NPDC005202]
MAEVVAGGLGAAEGEGERGVADQPGELLATCWAAALIRPAVGAW